MHRKRILAFNILFELDIVNGCTWNTATYIQIVKEIWLIASALQFNRISFILFYNVSVETRLLLYHGLYYKVPISITRAKIRPKLASNQRMSENKQNRMPFYCYFWELVCCHSSTIVKFFLVTLFHRVCHTLTTNFRHNASYAWFLVLVDL